MAYNLKEVSNKPERLTGGHRMCAGCAAPVVVRTVLRALKEEDKAVISILLQAVLKYQLSHIHIQHGKILSIMQHSKMQVQMLPELKQLIVT